MDLNRVLTFCFEIIGREGEKFNAGIDGTIASQMTAANVTNINYDIVHNRCSYLYRCGPVNLSFAKECFAKFFSANKFVGYLSSLMLKSNLTICSLTQGPALDCIAFLQSFQENYKFPLLFENINLISKYGAWRNTVNIMHQMITDDYKDPSIPQLLGNIKVVQGDPFVDLTDKLKNPINESDVVIMMKTLNLQADGYNPHTVISSIKVFLAALKEDTLLFCMDTKPSIALITEAISTFNGKVLFQPTYINTLIQVEDMDVYKTIYGCTPLSGARGTFLVWQKKSLSLPSPTNIDLNRFSESMKTVLKIDNDSGYSDNIAQINCNSSVILNDPFYSSTPTHSTRENKAFSLSEDLKFKTDELFDDWICTAAQSTECFPPRSTYIDGCEHVLENGPAVTNLTHLVSADKSVQTTPEDSFDNFESVKIASLTEKISNLTQSLKSLLETNEVQDTGPNCPSCLKPKKCAATNSVGSQSSCEHCLSETLFTKKCCSEGLHNSCNYLDKCAMKDSSNHLHSQCSSLCKQHCSNDSLSGLKIKENCASSLNGVKISAEQKTVPKLVIPLNNLSGDVIAQIVSLISSANQDS